MLKDIVLAALLHDVGKLAERGQPEEFAGMPDAEVADYGYPHAAATERFLTQYVHYDGRQPPWFNYAAMHHKPSDNSPMEWMIAEADRLSSGMERAPYAAEERDSGQQKFKTPLKPVTEFIALQETEPIDGQYYFPLKTLQPDELNVFPRKMPAELDLTQDYRTLFKQFTIEFEKLVKYGIEAKIDTLYFLLQKFWWAVPSTTRKHDFPDISLFEHSKTTAALASCLWLYHLSNGTERNIQAIRNRKPKKFLLFSGDIGGIQNFIYQISSKGAYSLLKGRSFYIQILSDLAAQFFFENLGLTRVNLIYSSGGKFYLLLPNTPQVTENLQKLASRINEELFRKFDGDLFLRTAFAEMSGEDLMLKKSDENLIMEKDGLYLIWQEVNQKLHHQAQQPFRSLLQKEDWYRQNFAPEGWDLETCAVCHKEMKEKEMIIRDDMKYCPTCLYLEQLGQKLKKAKYLILAHSTSNKENIFLDKAIFVREELEEESNEKKESWLNKLKSDDLLLQLNSADYSELFRNELFKNHQAKWRQGIKEVPNYQVGFRFYGGTRKLEGTFDEIAKKTDCGFQKLGVLRMDVDNLGMIFSNGLRNYKVKPHKERPYTNFYSLARLTTLSAQLDIFFSGYLNNLIQSEEESKAAIVYAGGDDLFIVGAWDLVMEKALQIRKKFEQFTCHNPVFTMSAGLTITGGKFPIYKSAEYAGAAEEKAKTFEHNGQQKNAFNAFELTLSWPEWNFVGSLKEKLLSQMARNGSNGKYDRALVGHLWLIVEEYQKRALAYRQHEFSLARIKQLVRHERWLWRMVYDLTRFKERHSGMANTIDQLKELLAGDQREQAGERPFIELLPALTRWIDYLTR
ncbi:MAG: type III-A CRISPR-associated protein Cas10/Csm1 [Caldisericaceae bacterium]|nr:type III-A CRISPR-associated protein Cas10/Csm1 [Caldisericaceae bacterium]